MWSVWGLYTGAGDGIRTRDPKLGKLMLYQLSYTRANEKSIITLGGCQQISTGDTGKVNPAFSPIIFHREIRTVCFGRRLCYD